LLGVPFLHLGKVAENQAGPTCTTFISSTPSFSSELLLDFVAIHLIYIYVGNTVVHSIVGQSIVSDSLPWMVMVVLVLLISVKEWLQWEVRLIWTLKFNSMIL
jgi:hypothetical protein